MLPDHAIVMHPGPMNRGMEIAAEVADSARSTIVEQVTNGVSVRMAVLYLLLAGSDEPEVTGMSGATSYVVKGARLLGGEPSDLLLEDGVIAEVGAGLTPGRRRGRSTPTGWSRCPAWSTCTPTCASPAARTPRPSRPARAAAALGGFTAVHAMANTDPVADTAGVVEQVWRLGREAGPLRRAARSAPSPSGWRGERLAELGAMADSRRPGAGLLRRRATASPTRC